MESSETQSRKRKTKTTVTQDKIEQIKSTAQLQIDSSSKIESRIQVAAYFKAQLRGFTPGHELDDWLAAEKEVNQ